MWEENVLRNRLGQTRHSLVVLGNNLNKNIFFLFISFRLRRTLTWNNPTSPPLPAPDRLGKSTYIYVCVSTYLNLNRVQSFFPASELVSQNWGAADNLIQGDEVHSSNSRANNKRFEEALHCCDEWTGGRMDLREAMVWRQEKVRRTKQ